MNHLSQLSSLAQVLNQETDSYTKSLTELEKKINALNLGIETWVLLIESGESGNSNRGFYRQTLLGYAKTDEGWGFAVQERRVERGFFENDSNCPYENECDEGPAKLLLKSSRDLRIRAARKIEDLLEGLIAKANDVIPTLKKAKELSQTI
jgi:hypothetical protein